MELTPEEIRVLGCLVEKEATTPDNYPLSSNALVNACNQTTSRDPVVNYSEREVDQTMIALREQGLARTVRGDGQRVHKHKPLPEQVAMLERIRHTVGAKGNGQGAGAPRRIATRPQPRAMQ